MSDPVLGLDLSLRSTGICVVPAGWRVTDWPALVVKRVGYQLRNDADEWERSRRIDDITVQVLEHASRHRCKVAAIEEYSFSRSSGHAFERGELGGVVKRELWKAGVVVVPYTATSSRKLLGKAPRKGAKEWAQQQLVKAGAPRNWIEDEYDAFLAANHHLSLTTGQALMIPAEAA